MSAGGRGMQAGPERELRRAALAALLIREPAAKVAAVRALSRRPHPRNVDRDALLPTPPDVPGRPPRPVLVAPAKVKARSVGSTHGRAAMLHALAHIEFNAINLALDAIWRFAGMPVGYYTDWLQVAVDEAHHFVLLQHRLHAVGVEYGDLPAHDGLWEMAEKTRADVLERMALVPRTLEARGLDASPRVRDKFAAAADDASARVIDIILREEIGHVLVGNRWFRAVCSARGVDPGTAYRELARRHGAPTVRAPVNVAARRAAGFESAELRCLVDGRLAASVDLLNPSTG